MGLIVSPQNVPLTIYQGATFRQTLLWKYGPSASAATPVNLTEASARAQIRTSISAAETLVSLTSAAEGGLTLGGASGEIVVKLSSAVTAALPAGQMVWDLEIVWPDGDVCRLARGLVTVDPEVTR